MNSEFKCIAQFGTGKGCRGTKEIDVENGCSNFPSSPDEAFKRIVLLGSLEQPVELAICWPDLLGYVGKAFTMTLNF